MAEEMKRPTVAAIMPVYNQEMYVEEAIRTVAPYVDHFIAVDDCSTDSTLEIITETLKALAEGRAGQEKKSEAAIVPLRENGRTAHAINTGFACVTDAEWCTWVSGDNFYAGDWVSSLLRLAEPDVGVIYSAYYHGSYDHVFHLPYDPNRLINDQNCFFGPCFLIRTEVWRAVGGHRGKISHDYDHWLRVEEECAKRNLRIVCHPQPVCFYRTHDQRATVTRRREYDADHWQMVGKARRCNRGVEPLE